MKIDDLFLRTMKGDNTLKDGSVESLMIRAGLVKRLNGRVGFTTFGLLLRNRLEEMIDAVLSESGYVGIEISGQKSLRELSYSLHEYHETSANSYKDIPMKFCMTDSLEFRKENSNSLWKSRVQKAVVISALGLEPKELEKVYRKVHERIGLQVELDHGGFYYPLATGQDRFTADQVVEVNLSEEKTEQISVEKLSLIPTPGIRTIEALGEFLHVEHRDIMKTMILSDGEKNYAALLPGDRDVDLNRVTRVLGLLEGSLMPASADRVEEITGAEVGFAGPVDLKVDAILVDTGIKRGSTYMAGANKTDHHYSGVLYGRDFSGDFHSISRRTRERSGWLLGEVRTDAEKIRVQGVNGKFDYHEMSFAYFNLERMMLAILEEGMDSIGLQLTPELSLFQAVVSIVDRRDEESLVLGERLYSKLMTEGVRALYDDRKDRMGSKFMDYDLMGIDKRVIVGKNGQFDVKDRSGEVVEATMQNIVEIIQP